jgi:cobalt-zinc-cadmium efflux system protein
MESATGEGHSHAVPDHRGRLSITLAISLAVLIAEVVGGLQANSLALLADAGHLLSDVAGLLMAVTAAVLMRRPPTDKRTWGFRRAEVLAAAAQAAILLAVGVFVLWTAVSRLIHPPEVEQGTMLLFALVALVGNIAAVAVLVGERSSNLNMRAAFLEVVNDGLGSVAVLIAAGVIAGTGWARADPVASLVIGLLILPRTLRLLWESLRVLLESTPRGLDLAEVRERILDREHVLHVHDLHASQVATGLPILTAHVVVDDSCFYDGHLTGMLDELQACLVDDFDIEHSTIQFEPARHTDHERETHR